MKFYGIKDVKFVFCIGIIFGILEENLV